MREQKDPQKQVTTKGYTMDTNYTQDDEHETARNSLSE